MLSDEQCDSVIEAAENAVGMGHGAWDMVNPRDLVRAVASALSQSTEQGERDAARLNWLESDGCTDVFKLGRNWYTREGYGSPHHKAKSLRSAIDAAMSPHGDGGNYTRAEGGGDGASRLRLDVLQEIAQTFGLDYNAVCRCANAYLAGVNPSSQDQQEQPR